MLDQKFKVYLKKIQGYNDSALVDSVSTSLKEIGFSPSPSTKVLVKPNLLVAKPLACTSPEIVRAACLYLLDCGCHIEIADSPGFGRASKVADAIGMNQILPNGLQVHGMGAKVEKKLQEGGIVGIAKKALEADIILNLPKFKAHRMMRFTGAVKNLYGCISGLEKALLHRKYGDRIHNDVRVFSSLVVDIEQYLPPQVALIDAITAMSTYGPQSGEALDLNFIAASNSSIALDTAMYTMLDKDIALFPLWNELQRRKIAGAFVEDIEWLGEDRKAIDISAFKLPEKLISESFSPRMFIESTFQRIVALFKV